MLRRREGSIVNISSVVGRRGNAGQANYAAAKAGIIGLTKSLAKELGARAIRVNAVAPGYIDTAMTQALPDDVKQAIVDNTPLQQHRAGRPTSPTPCCFSHRRCRGTLPGAYSRSTAASASDRNPKAAVVRPIR